MMQKIKLTTPKNMFLLHVSPYSLRKGVTSEVVCQKKDTSSLHKFPYPPLCSFTSRSVEYLFGLLPLQCRGNGICWVSLLRAPAGRLATRSSNSSKGTSQDDMDGPSFSTHRLCHQFDSGLFAHSRLRHVTSRVILFEVGVNSVGGCVTNLTCGMHTHFLCANI